jgi:ribonuclease Z
MTFELTVLGSSSALPTSTKFPSAHVLNVQERFFLIDCGEGTQMQLRKAKIKFGRIDHLFISHLHGDHIFGLFGLLSTYNLLGRKSDFHIYSEPGIQKIVDFYIDHFTLDNSFKIIVHQIKQRKFQKIFEDKVVEVFAFPLKHRIPTFGFLFREQPRQLNISKEKIEKLNLSIPQLISIKKGEDIKTDDGTVIPNSELTIPAFRSRSYAYCSDTSKYEKIISYIEGVDILYHETTFLEKDKKLAKMTGHSTALQAADIALKAKVSKLLIGHFSSRYKTIALFEKEAQEIFQNTEAVKDGLVYSVMLK